MEIPYAFDAPQKTAFFFVHRLLDSTQFFLRKLMIHDNLLIEQLFEKGVDIERITSNCSTESSYIEWLTILIIQ